MRMKSVLGSLLCWCLSQLVYAQPADSNLLWHLQQRILRYHPEGRDIVITNGQRRFTRALYGGNSAFRVEAGDLPEFAMYMPGMGGNIKFGIINGKQAKWLIKADTIVASYGMGSMVYQIKDRLLGKGTLFLKVLALHEAEGVIIEIKSAGDLGAAKMMAVYGGATGKKFSRDGDMGPDPESSFYLKPEYCTDNKYVLQANQFSLSYGTGLMSASDPYENKNFPDTSKSRPLGKEYAMNGLFPASVALQLVDAAKQDDPLQLWDSKPSNSKAIAGLFEVRPIAQYIALYKPEKKIDYQVASLPMVFAKADATIHTIADRIEVNTPDPFINTIGGNLSIAADAIWEAPTYLHGAIGWRMRLNGWRGPYVADVLGWHDRAKMHFKAYSESQLTEPLSGKVVADTALHLARSLEQLGTSVFSSGYISRNPNGDFRPHHYDMNLVYIDALFRHFYWTGDLAFAKQIWPVIQKHLAWEKRNFDADDDGLYDAYAAIWASDALQYSGGAVTHSSAYNYKANKEAAALAVLIGEDAHPYQKEADKILAALNNKLWLKDKCVYAEYQDLLGHQLLHDHPAVWTIYHAMDSEVPDPFQAYMMMHYIDQEIPHIPVRAKGLEEGFATISTSQWMPYDWSLNNVATGEVMHTSLAYWQAGLSDKAFQLWKSELLSTMYLGGSPGNIGQISFYDANRGEAYRDFADPIAMTARALVEGLFGIRPNALQKELVVAPGFPASWDHASLKTPDIHISFQRMGNKDQYQILPAFSSAMKLLLHVPARQSILQSVLVNGKQVKWHNKDAAVGQPMIDIEVAAQEKYLIELIWSGASIQHIGTRHLLMGEALRVQMPQAKILHIRDASGVFESHMLQHGSLYAQLKQVPGKHHVFLQLQQDEIRWWEPIELDLREAIEIKSSSNNSNRLQFDIMNNSAQKVSLALLINQKNHGDSILIPAHSTVHQSISDPAVLVPGSNTIMLQNNQERLQKILINWSAANQPLRIRQVDLSAYFNDQVTQIFKHQYLSPRPITPTLQLPTQGIGDWTHPLKTAEIIDTGLRKSAGPFNRIDLPQGISFQTPSNPTKPNIVFSSMWDNFPHSIQIPLTGNASHAYLLMAGSTNPMQSRMVNGRVIIQYQDQSSDTLLLKNPESWWPIEQDYLEDGFAFHTDAPRPIRVHLKTGKIVSGSDPQSLHFNGKMIDGGAATVLDLPLQEQKKLASLQLETVANDVIIGLMAISLASNE